MGRVFFFILILTALVASGVALYTIAYWANANASANVASSPRTQHSNVSPPQCFNPAAVIPLFGKTCGIVQDLQLSCSVPADMLVNAQQPDFTFSQRSADVFSWQEFIALNWPARAGERGLPDWDKQISEAGPRVWETWKEEYEVYLPDGQKPPAWNDLEKLPATRATRGATKVFFRSQKIDDVIDSTLQAAAADGTLPATLTDQKGRLVRYEIRLNKVLFDYIVQNKLYNATVQNAAPAIAFPSGAMLIKAAWREVEPAEEAVFHTVTAYVCDRRKSGTLYNCRTKRMGLVGLHITQKTPSAPQWIWSTFEHVNNVPDVTATGPLSFNNPACPTCPTNQQTHRGTPNQMVRTIAIPDVNPDCQHLDQGLDNVRLLNANVQEALSKAQSVFRYYALINTQWPTPPTHRQPETVFSVRPLALGNTTMESFVQQTSSCMGCHSTARTVNANRFVSSDFSFTLNNAQPRQKSCKIIPPPHRPHTEWERTHWAQIKQGYALAVHTYEMLPRFVPAAQLHCGSCHLNAGANADAAWWVDLQKRFPTKPQLQNRINHCFTNSLNGHALCTPTGFGPRADCDTNVNMNALTTYMEWLTKQAAILPLCPTVTSGFPPIAPLFGDKDAGQQIFIEKCAVCHGLDGQGRYTSNMYFRPALWGPHSFNQAAGMFSDPTFLAAFVRWNMPLMAGGQLTDQEAWDLEAFIHAKPRPQLKH